MKRTHYCGNVLETLENQMVTVQGWVHRRRDHGGVIFIDLRDREGLVQVVVNPDQVTAFRVAETARNEFVMQVTGMVKPRLEGTVNDQLPTGKIEIVAEKVDILNASEPVPFRIDEHQEVSEDVRLRHRYLDIRRPEMINRLRFRARLNQLLRNFLDQQEFIEVETPILTKATPEGARDYLVPSRVHPGQFYALPQSPQVFKQLLMVSGVDRYYQIVRCFRDEDLRADRQPEFTQLDVEMSFVDESDIQTLMESMLKHAFKILMNVTLPDFPRMTYAESIRRYGIDRPDLRIPLELVDVADLMASVDFKVFAVPANDQAGRVAALKIPGGCQLSRKAIDDYTKFVAIYGAKGLAYIKVNTLANGIAGLQSPILKFLPDDVVLAIMDRVSAQDGDLVFFGADQAKIVNEALGALRVKVAEDLDLVEAGWKPVWIIDFPMFEKDDKEGRWQALHHPFTAPNTTDVQAVSDNPGEALSRAYDIVLNGYEIGGGSIRIHDRQMQQSVFDILGIDHEQQQAKFGHLLAGLKYGAPPHGGIAFGLDRLVMLMTSTQAIRDVIAFPKTQSAACPLTDAPSDVDMKQLLELNIRVNAKPVV